MPCLKRGHARDHSCTSAIEAIYGNMESLPPELEMDVGGIQHAAHGLHNRAIIPLRYSVLLRSVGCCHLVVYCLLPQIILEGGIGELCSTISAQGDDLGARLSFQLRNIESEAIQSIRFLGHTENHPIACGIILKEHKIAGSGYGINVHWTAYV